MMESSWVIWRLGELVLEIEKKGSEFIWNAKSATLKMHLCSSFEKGLLMPIFLGSISLDLNPCDIKLRAAEMEICPMNPGLTLFPSYPPVTKSGGASVEARRAACAGETGMSFL